MPCEIPSALFLILVDAALSRSSISGEFATNSTLKGDTLPVSHEPGGQPLRCFDARQARIIKAGSGVVQDLAN